MKFSMLLIMAVFFVGSAKAAEIPAKITGTAENIYCGEMDPFVVGDACLVFTTDEATGLKLGLLYSDYDFLSVHVPEPGSSDDMLGDRFQASGCERIYDRNAIDVLKRFDSGYFYLNCYVYDFSWLHGQE